MKKKKIFSKNIQEKTQKEVINEKINQVHVLFEQSGTFKKEFQKFGIPAFDYDIENRFNETDIQIDLLEEIEKAKMHVKSIFDGFSQDDLLLAFYPCTFFSGQNELFFSGVAYQFQKWSNEKKQEYINERLETREIYLHILQDLVEICEERKLRLIIENPYQNSYLIRSGRFLAPSLVIQDRRIDGDWFKKPTAFWFINCEPHDNELDEDDVLKPVEPKTISSTHAIERSLMHSQFARRFIKKYIL